MRLRLNGETIFDATNCTLTFTRETKQRAATKDTSAGVSTKSTKNWSAGYGGLLVYAGDGNGGHTFKDLFDVYDNDDEAANPTVQFIPDESDYQWYYEGVGIITNLVMNGTVDEDGTITLDITNAGPMAVYDKAVNDPDT